MIDRRVLIHICQQKQVHSKVEVTHRNCQVDVGALVMQGQLSDRVDAFFSDLLFAIQLRYVFRLVCPPVLYLG